jgi:hypothetical protein
MPNRSKFPAGAAPQIRVEVAARLRLRYEMVMAILAAHDGGIVPANERRHVSRDA